MVLEGPGQGLVERSLAPPEPAPGEVLIRVRACGVCRTDLHVVDGELPEPKLPLVPGHQIVGRVVAAGREAERFAAGDRVGVPWLGWTCGECRQCVAGRENLCERAVLHGLPARRRLRGATPPRTSASASRFRTAIGIVRPPRSSARA